MCFDRENNRQITEYPLYLHEDEKGNSEIIGRRGRKVRRVEMGGGMPEGGEPYQQLVTDGEGKTVWEDRLAYSEERAFFDAGAYVLYKVSDEIPDYLTGLSVGDKFSVWANQEKTVASAYYLGDEWAASSELTVMVAYVDNAKMVLNGQQLGILPEKGVYFAKTADVTITGIAPAGATAPEITWDGQTSVVKQIDPKYLPEGVGGGMVVTFTFNSDTFEVTADKAFEDVWQELRAGKNVIGMTVTDNEDILTGTTSSTVTYASAYASDKQGHRLIAFGTTSLLGNRASMVTMKFYDDESVAQESMQLAPYSS